jgi:hypothetical protein
LASQGDADSVDGADGASSRGFDDRANVGVELGSPLASKAVCDLAVDRAGTQGSLRAVIGRFDVPVGDKDEQVAADRLDCLLEFSSGLGGWLQTQEAVEPAVQVAEVDFERAASVACRRSGISSPRCCGVIRTASSASRSKVADGIRAARPGSRPSVRT